MKVYKNSQLLKQLEKRKGGYYFLTINAEVVNEFKNGKHTRFVCNVDKILAFSCGLNHLGNGNFFIILATRNVKSISKRAGDMVSFESREDPNPLGVKLPEVLTALLEQDESLKQKFDNLTSGKKRSLVHAISRIKDLDKQVAKTTELLQNGVKLRNKPVK